MKQILYPITILLFLSLSTFAQKEIFFNDTKPEDMKVASVQGIDIVLTDISLNNFRIINNSGGFLIDIGYFNEKRIAPRWTFITRIGLQNNFYKQTLYVNYIDSVYFNDTIQYNNAQRIDGYESVYQLRLKINIEPRWYFGYKKRFQVGKAKLNSGWYLSLPVIASKSLINTSKINESDAIAKEYGNLQYCPSLGYRQALSNRLFLEGNASLLNGSVSFVKFPTKLCVTHTLMVVPTINIKAAYTF